MKKKFLVICFMMFFVLSISPAHSEEKKPIRLGVMKFLSRAEGVTEKQAEAIGDIFSRMLTNSKSIIIVERDRIDEIANEHQLTKSGRFEDDTVIQLGKLIGCQYMLLGAVTNLERKTKTTDLWLVNETKQDVTATIDVRVVEVETSKIIHSFSESGSSSQKGSGVNFYGFQTNDNDFSGIEIPAITEAVSRAGFHIRETLADEYAQVVDVDTKEITINAGENWGIAPGNLFRVYSEGKELFDLEGNSVGKKLNLVAIVKITEVQRDLCTAQVIKNGGRASHIRKGYRIQPITQREADDLVKKKVFSSSSKERTSKSKNDKKKKK
ncbi:MAG: hypothetical protein IJQ99_08240 [Synergistaceae bacterium]|nr:hypothetical protein [Synergistaceae bacterium]